MARHADNGFRIGIYQPEDQAELLALWQQCGLIVPWNNPLSDIDRKLADSPGLFFVGKIGSRLVASCMAGYDGHRGWIYFLAVLPAEQRAGLAARMVAQAEASLAELGCPKIDLMVRDSNTEVLAFYQSVGYRLDPVRVLSKRLLEDEAHDFTPAGADSAV
jgi:ribosomal protein S18 acetylase RimI-like enzyme